MIIEAEFITETEKAILLKIEGEERWIPNSVISDIEEDCNKPNKIIEVDIKDWFCEKNGLD